jgi:hypothetical protein
MHQHDALDPVARTRIPSSQQAFQVLPRHSRQRIAIASAYALVTTHNCFLLNIFLLMGLNEPDPFVTVEQTGIVARERMHQPRQGTHLARRHQQMNMIAHQHIRVQATSKSHQHMPQALQVALAILVVQKARQAIVAPAAPRAAEHRQVRNVEVGPYPTASQTVRPATISASRALPSSQPPTPCQKLSLTPFLDGLGRPVKGICFGRTNSVPDRQLPF